jgi:hypothetical protein
MNGSYQHDVNRRCLPFGFVPRQAIALRPRAFSAATT